MKKKAKQRKFLKHVNIVFSLSSQTITESAKTIIYFELTNFYSHVGRLKNLIWMLQYSPRSEVQSQLLISRGAGLYQFPTQKLSRQLIGRNNRSKFSLQTDFRIQILHGIVTKIVRLRWYVGIFCSRTEFVQQDSVHQLESFSSPNR